MEHVPIANPTLAVRAFVGVNSQSSESRSALYSHPMEIDHAAEWQRLTRHYGDMGDEELSELADQFGDLTEMAQQVLRDEMRKRRLVDPGASRELEGLREETRRREEGRPSARQPLVPSSQSGAAFGLPGIAPSQWDTGPELPAEDEEAGEEGQEYEYTWKTPLCEYETREEAWQVSEMLRRAGIESWIELPQSYALELSGPRVVVAADQFDQARQIAAQPVPQDIVDESRMKVPEFETPRCPRCGAEDPVLESVEPSNTWCCEICGHEWSDLVENSSQKTQIADR
jgi:hypothetical protein